MTDENLSALVALVNEEANQNRSTSRERLGQLDAQVKPLNSRLEPAFHSLNCCFRKCFRTSTGCSLNR